MRIHFPNMARPKRAARTIARLLPGVPLARAQAAAARACGYRDWFDLELHHAGAPPTPDLDGPALHAAAVGATLRLADAAGVDHGAAQHALGQARLLDGKGWSLDDHLAVRTGCWRATGALDGWHTLAILPVWGGRAYARERGAREVYNYRGQPCHAGEAGAAEAEGIPDFVSPRLYLPYGKWTMADGSTVLFSTDYKALWRLAGGEPERLDQRTWVDGIVDQEWFWIRPQTDPFRDPASMARQLARLESYGIKGLPALADRQPLLMGEMRVPERFNPGLDGIPARYPVLNCRGEDGGRRFRISDRLYRFTGGTRPWHEVPRQGIQAAG